MVVSCPTQTRRCHFYGKKNNNNLINKEILREMYLATDSYFSQSKYKVEGIKMSSSGTVDLNELLSPIPGEIPGGHDIRQNQSISSPYNQIKDARATARAAERNSLFDGKSDMAMENWQKILDLAPVILRDHAKDLEIAAWYTEALIRKQGFKGLNSGFTLIRHLIEIFWDSLYPMPDEDGLETRISPLTGLNGEGAEGVLIPPIRNSVITESHYPGPFTIWQYKQALDIQKISDADLRDKKTEQIGFSIADIQSTVSKSSDQFFIDLHNDIHTSIAEYRKIGELLDNHCGTHEGPPTSNIINALEDALATVKFLGKSKIPDTISDASSSPAEQSGHDSNQGTTASSEATQRLGPIRSRDDAFRQLNNIVDFFRKTEPHSPICYSIERAIKWGNMPLNELILELIPDDSSRDIYK